MWSEIVGREEELASLHAFIGAAQGGGLAALVLEGEAGIGKSTLWLAGVEHARAQRLARSLVAAGRGRARPRSRRARRSVRGRPRRRPARAVGAEAARARGRAAPGGGVGRSRRSTARSAVAVRGVLQLLSEREPVLIAVDDVQWLDPSSSSALAFALRRLDANDVLLLLARRLVDGAQPSELEQALDAGARPAAAGGAAQRRRAPSVPARPARQAVRAPDAAPHPRAVGREPVLRARAGPRSRRRRRPAAAAPGSRDARGARAREDLRAPGVHPRGARARLGAGHAVGVAARAGGRRRGRARAGGRRARDRARERDDSLHPSAAVVGPLPGPRARSGGASTRRIAGSSTTRSSAPVTSRSRRTRRTPTSPPCSTTPRRLAADRGASAVAAELAEQALRLTPPDAHEERHRRALAAARAHQAAGEWTRARTIATDLLAETEIGPLRAEALVLLAELESVDRAVALLEEALREAASRPALQSLIHCRLAWATRFRKGFAAALEHARAALELADAARRRRAPGRALARCTRSSAGSPATPRRPAISRRARTSSRPPSATSSCVQEATQARREHARAVVRAATRPARCSSASTESGASATSRGAPARSGASPGSSSGPGAGSSRPSTPPAHATSRSSTGSRCRRTTSRSPSIAVHRGQLELAREHSERALELWPRSSSGSHPPQHLGGPRARRALERRRVGGRGLARQGRPAGRGSSGGASRASAGGPPTTSRCCSSSAGSTTRSRVLDVWEADAARLDREWVLAHVTRCRGLVAAAQGDVEQRRSLLEQAVAQHEAVGDPFGRARALLALGIVRRRARQKRAAREAIEAALGGFEQLGAATWVDEGARRARTASAGARARRG